MVDLKIFNDFLNDFFKIVVVVVRQWLVLSVYCSVIYAAVLISRKKNFLLSTSYVIYCSYTGLLLVTTTEKIEVSDRSLEELTKQIYENANLGNQDCDNGILIIYIRDKKQVYWINFKKISSFIRHYSTAIFLYSLFKKKKKKERIKNNGIAEW